MKYKKDVECDICGGSVNLRNIQDNTCCMCCLVACDKCIDAEERLCVYCKDDRYDNTLYENFNP